MRLPRRICSRRIAVAKAEASKRLEVPTLKIEFREETGLFPLIFWFRLHVHGASTESFVAIVDEDAIGAGQPRLALKAIVV